MAAEPVPSLLRPFIFTLIASATVTLSACVDRKPSLVPSDGPRDTQHLRREIDEVLARPALDRGTWGIIVRSLATGETLYSLNPRRLLTPASAMKIVTLAVAAEQLGWEHAYETRLLGAGPVRDGVLEGDLVVVGSGDPSLAEADGSATRAFAAWATELKARGIQAITGRVIGHDDAFDDEPLGAGWMWDDLAFGYSAGIGALQLNANTTRVTIVPGASVGQPAAASLASDGSGLRLLPRVVTAEPGAPAIVRFRRLAGSATLEVSGRIALGAEAVERSIAVDNPTLHFIVELRKALVANGIEVRGPAVDVDTIPDPPSIDSAVSLVTHRSPPLSVLAVTLMKTSQNQYAETLLKSLGASAGAGTVEAGRTVVLDVLARWGVPVGQLVLADGSGLSRYDLVTAEALGTILARLSRDARLREPFEASLPLAGRDGTLTNRLQGTPAEGNARAKTGSMTNARTIAGFVTTASGERLVFAILANNFGIPAEAIDEASDTIIARLAALRRAPTRSRS